MQPNFHLTGGLGPQDAPAGTPAENSSPLPRPASANAAASAPAEAPSTNSTVTSVAVAPAPPAVVEQIAPNAISTPQSLVLAALSAGKSIAAAAAEAGVSRSTVYRWHHDPDFVAALNAWKRQTRESAHHRLLALSDLAVNTVQAALQGADARTAMSLLRELGILRKVIAGSSDRDEVNAKAELKRFSKDVDRRRRFKEAYVVNRDVKDWKDMYRIVFPWEQYSRPGKK